MSLMEQQATKFGTTVKMGCLVKQVKPIEGGFELSWHDMYQGVDDSAEFRSVIIATGASARYLGIDGEAEFLDGTGQKTGLTACATCDGAFYRDVPVCVIGGGDTACEEAMFLTRFASKVYLIHRRDELRASKVMAERTLANDKIEPIWNTTLESYHTDDNGKMCGVTLKSTADGTSELEISGVFMAIGHTPNTGFLADTGITTDDQGYIEVEGGCRTSVPGIFAAGDVRDTTYRQAITAAGMGCMAALEAERYLDD